MTITLDPPTELDRLGVNALTRDPDAPGERISFAALWARAEADDAAARDDRSMPRRPLEAPVERPTRRRPSPGSIGGVQVLPAVLDHIAVAVAPQPSPRVDGSLTTPILRRSRRHRHDRRHRTGTPVDTHPVDADAVDTHAVDTDDVAARPAARVWFVDAPDNLLDDAPIGVAAVAAARRPLARLLVSPEFERRRKAVEAELRRRARQPLWWALLGLVTVVLVVAVLFSPLVAVRDVEVRGVDAPTAATIRSAAEPLRGRPMFRTDPVSIVHRLVARADIASVRVTKVWPDRIVIEPAMRRPLAIVRTKGAPDRVIDESGTVMSGAAGFGLVLPVIAEGAAASPRGFRESAQVVRAVDPSLRVRLSQVDHDANAYTLHFGRAAVRIGRATDLAAKAAALTTLAAAGQLDSTATIDLSVPDTAIVTASPASSPVASPSATGSANP